MKEFLKKFKSMKLLITIWGMAILSFIVIANRSDFLSLATTLALLPLCYCGCNVAEDWVKKGERS